MAALHLSYNVGSLGGERNRLTHGFRLVKGSFRAFSLKGTESQCKLLERKRNKGNHWFPKLGSSEALGMAQSRGVVIVTSLSHLCGAAECGLGSSRQGRDPRILLGVRDRKR